jgi:hypothetical protein
MVSPLITLLFGAAIALNLEESAELPLETAVKIVDALARAIAGRTGAKPIVDDPTWSGCKREDRCLIDIAARTQANEVVLVRVFGGALSHRVIAERFRDRVMIARAELSVPERAEEWSAALDQIATVLFPMISKPASSSETLVPPVESARVEPKSLSPWPFVALGSGAAMLIAGIAVGISSAHARDRLETEILAEPEYNALYRKSAREQHLANGLFAGAAAGAAIGVVLFFID